MFCEPAEKRDNHTLIPRTGVQFVDLAFDLDSLRTKSWAFYIDDGNVAYLQTDPETNALYYFTDAGDRREIESPTFEVSRKTILETVLGEWIPIPYFKQQPPDGFADGPENWARIRVIDIEKTFGQRDRRNNSHHATLAFDTNLLERTLGRPYLGPSSEDTRSGAVFKLANELRHIGTFLQKDWIAKWIFELYCPLAFRALGTKAKEDRVRKYMEEEYGVNCFDFAIYISFLHLLAELRVLPEISFTDIDSEAKRAVIPVDLVLDLGNSRTCGMAIEFSPDKGARIESATSLELRDLSRPEFFTNRPFESRVEFAKVQFGKEYISPLSGRSDAFLWPSIVRVGDEAARLAGLREGTGGDTGMSSPKRYLWDFAPRTQSWRFNGRSIEGELEPFAKEGRFAQLVTRDGTPRHGMAKDDPENLPAVEARYSRSSMMMFALGEILLQALMMVNSSAYRYRRGYSDTPRHLRTMIMTMPSAMPLPERKILELRARDAIDIVWEALQCRDEKPKLEVQWDEASATQLVFLYNEVAQNFSGEAEAFFNIMRRPDQFPGRDKQLRIASIDIGGGTTDLIVTDYLVEGGGQSIAITPKQLFREGFNVAGDDILKAVIDKHVLVAIEKGLSAAGVINAKELVNEVFGGDRSGMEIAESARRQQFISQVAVPIGLGLLSEVERHDAFENLEAKSKYFEDFFTPATRPNEQIILFLNNKAIERGGHAFDLRKIEFSFRFDALAATIHSVLGAPLGALCEAVQAYHCDTLLLSGRPSRLVTVLEIVRSALPLPLERLIPLYGYKADWYPFRKHDNTISDPKTTAAVGAMIGALARGGLPYFMFRSSELKPMSTARYFGVLDAKGSIKDRDLYYKDMRLGDEDYQLPSDVAIPMYNTMSLGFRQLPLERWPATRLYSLGFASQDDGNKLSNSLPIKIYLRKGAGLGASKNSFSRELGKNVETFTIERVESSGEGRPASTNQIKLTLMTLESEQGYWLDSGAIR